MSTIYVRKATEKDLTSIMEIIDQAKKLLKADGSQQWQNGNPNEEVIRRDIEKGYCQVLMVGDQIAGTSALLTDPDPNYKTILDGSWKNNSAPYATIHRLAISEKYRGRGIASIFISNLLSLAYAQGFRYFRIDTHEQNIRTQGLIEKFGFEYRGRIFVDPTPEGERLAYERHLN